MESTLNGHVLKTRDTCGCDGKQQLCPVCDWGLSICVNCGAAEAELSKSCNSKKSQRNNPNPQP